MLIRNHALVGRLNKITEMSTIRLPAKVSYALQKNRKALYKEYECYYEELTKLQEQYPDAGEEYNKELAELLNIEVDVPIHKVSEDLLENARDDLSLDVFDTLEFMFEDVQEEKIDGQSHDNN